MGVERFIDGLRARYHQQRVTVRWRLGDDVSANGRARARAILHDEWLVQRLAQFFRDCAGIDIGRAAGAERNNDFDRARGIVIGYCGRRRSYEGACEREQGHDLSQEHHGLSSSGLCN